MAALDRSFISLALRLAEAAAPVAKRYFRQPIPIDDKADASPVTIADREIEETLRQILARERPEDGVIGEEFATTREGARHTWVIDPIDGTRSFIVITSYSIHYTKLYESRIGVAQPRLAGGLEVAALVVGECIEERANRGALDPVEHRILTREVVRNNFV